MIRAYRIGSCECESHGLFHATRADTKAVAIKLAVRQIPGSIGSESSDGREWSRGGAVSGGHAGKTERVVAFQLGIVLGAGGRCDHQSEPHGKDKIQLPHLLHRFSPW